MNVRRLLAAVLIAGTATTAAAPASAWIDVYCVKVAGYTFCTPPTTTAHP